MTAQENLVCTRHLIAAINRHDAAACATLFATAGTLVDTSGNKAEGRSAIEEEWRSLFAGFPDVVMTERGSMTPRPAAAVVEYTLTGTHLGPFKTRTADIPATGRSISLQQVSTLTFNAAGQILRQENVGDNLAMLLQLGLVQILNPGQLQGVAENLVSACNKHDGAAIAACFHELGALATGGEIALGRTAIQQTYAATFSAFPDLRITTQDVLVEGQRIAITARMQGTNTGAQAAAPATGKAIDVPITAVMDVNAAGLIVNQRNYFDQATIMTQIGALPAAK